MAEQKMLFETFLISTVLSNLVTVMFVKALVESGSIFELQSFANAETSPEVKGRVQKLKSSNPFP